MALTIAIIAGGIGGYILGHLRPASHLGAFSDLVIGFIGGAFGAFVMNMMGIGLVRSHGLDLPDVIAHVLGSAIWGGVVLALVARWHHTRK